MWRKVDKNFIAYFSMNKLTKKLQNIAVKEIYLKNMNNLPKVCYVYKFHSFHWLEW